MIVVLAISTYAEVWDGRKSVDRTNERCCEACCIASEIMIPVKRREEEEGINIRDGKADVPWICLGANESCCAIRVVVMWVGGKGKRKQKRRISKSGWVEIERGRRVDWLDYRIGWQEAGSSVRE